MTFDLPIIPVAKGRPRHTKGGHTYTPAKTRGYEAALKALVMAQCPHVEPLEGPLVLRIVFYLPRPKRLMRVCDPDGPVPAPLRPDLDNLVKALKDAMNGVLWSDDAQIVVLRASKWYHGKSGAPGVYLTVIPID